MAVICLPIFAQENTKDSNLVLDSINLSTSSIEKSGLTQEQIVRLDEQTRILLACIKNQLGKKPPWIACMKTL